MSWLVLPPPASGPFGPAAGAIGRELAPQVSEPLGLIGSGGGSAPLVGAVVTQIPGDGSARAIVAGRDAASGEGAIELVDLDAHRALWRDRGACRVVRGATAHAILCSTSDRDTRAITLADAPAWQVDESFAALTGDRVVTLAADGKAVVRDAATGGELVRVALPDGAVVQQICDRDLYAVARDKLIRVDAKPLWSTAVGAIASVDACSPGAIVLVTTIDGELIALARDTGKIVGRVGGVRGVWPARDGSDRIEVATSWSVARMPRDLSASEVLPLPPLGRLVASRGDRRFVRASPNTAVLLDAGGVRAFLPLALGDLATAALGDGAILAGDDRDAPASLVAIPPPWRRPLRVPANTAGIALPAELRDLPPVEPLGSAAIAELPAPGGSDDGAVAIALDPIAPALYVLSTRDDALSTELRHAQLWRFDLAARAWAHVRDDACVPAAARSPIEPVHYELAASRSAIVCATPAGIRATARDGAALWERANRGEHVAAAVADVVAIRAGRLVRVLDAADGHLLGSLATRALAALDIGGMALVVTAEAGRVVCRVPRAALAPAWSYLVRGTVESLAPSGDGVLVALDGGDAYRIDARTARAVAVAGIGLDWQALGDLVLGQTAGGPVPPSPLPLPPPPIPPEKYNPVPLEDAARIATPWPSPWPPGPALPPSRQLALFDLGGGVRARADYAIGPDIALVPLRGGGGSPIVALYGPAEPTERTPPRALVLDPAHGDPLRQVALPPDAWLADVFSTVVAGRPVVGVIARQPLRVVLF